MRDLKIVGRKSNSLHYGVGLKCDLTDAVFMSARKLGEYLTNAGYKGYNRNKMAYVMRALIRSFPNELPHLTPFNIKLVSLSPEELGEKATINKKNYCISCFSRL